MATVSTKTTLHGPAVTLEQPTHTVQAPQMRSYKHLALSTRHAQMELALMNILIVNPTLNAELTGL